MAQRCLRSRPRERLRRFESKLSIPRVKRQGARFGSAAGAQGAGRRDLWPGPHAVSASNPIIEQTLRGLAGIGVLHVSRRYGLEKQTNQNINKMKLHLPTFTALIAATLAITAAAAFGDIANGTARGGATDLLNSRPAPAVKQASSPTHQMAAQSCPSCRSTWNTVSVQQSKRNLAETLPVQKHQCGDCKTTLQTIGHGKAKQDVVAHACKQMASGNMASCCAN